MHISEVYCFIYMNNIVVIFVGFNFIFKIPINFSPSSFPSCFFITLYFMLLQNWNFTIVFYTLNSITYFVYILLHLFFGICMLIFLSYIMIKCRN